MEKIKITFEAYGITHTAEVNDSSNIYQLMPIVTSLIESMGYHPESILKGLEEEVERLINEL